MIHVTQQCGATSPLRLAIRHSEAASDSAKDYSVAKRGAWPLVFGRQTMSTFGQVAAFIL